MPKFSLIEWNVDGLGRLGKFKRESVLSTLSGLVKRHKPTILCLQEASLQDGGKSELQNALGSSYAIHDTMTKAGVGAVPPTLHWQHVDKDGNVESFDQTLPSVSADSDSYVLAIREGLSLKSSEVKKDFGGDLGVASYVEREITPFPLRRNRPKMQFTELLAKLAPGVQPRRRLVHYTIESSGSLYAHVLSWHAPGGSDIDGAEPRAAFRILLESSFLADLVAQKRPVLLCADLNLHVGTARNQLDGTASPVSASTSAGPPGPVGGKSPPRVLWETQGGLEAVIGWNVTSLKNLEQVRADAGGAHKAMAVEVAA